MVWSAAALDVYRRTGTVLRAQANTKVMKKVTSMVVLGTILSTSASDAVDHRLSKGWQAWIFLRPQMFLRGVRIEDRLVLLGAVVVPTVSWGMESFNPPAAQRSATGSRSYTAR